MLRPLPGDVPGVQLIFDIDAQDTEEQQAGESVNDLLKAKLCLWQSKWFGCLSDLQFCKSWSTTCRTSCERVELSEGVTAWSLYKFPFCGWTKYANSP